MAIQKLICINKKIGILFFVVVFSNWVPLFSQEKNNLGFENFNYSNDSLIAWEKKKALVTLDTLIFKEGKSSAHLRKIGDAGISGIRNTINLSFKGDTLLLEGFVRGEGVSNAYFFIILGTEKTQISHEMSNSFSGTFDWKKFSIKIPYVEEAEEIVVASNIEGSGEIWLDSFQLTLDGKNINNLKENNSVDEMKISSEFEYEIQNIHNLLLLSKVWGFVKYYHPIVAQGKVDMDQELFQLLDKIKKDNFQELLVHWISSLGKFEVHQERLYDSLAAYQDPDLKWITNDSLLSEPLQRKLNLLGRRIPPKTHHYVEIKEKGGFLQFKNEKIYPSMEVKETKKVILALFRYWNSIEYFYPYKDLISQDWDVVLKKFLQKISEIHSDLDYRLFLTELVKQTEDTHSIIVEDEILAKFYGLKKLPFKVKFVENELTVEGNSEIAGIERGRVIKEIDNVPVDQLQKELLRYSVASNDKATLRDLSQKIMRTNKEFSKVKFKNGFVLDSIRNSSFYGSPPQDLLPSIPPDSEIGYLNAVNLSQEEVERSINSNITKKVLLIDLRGYPKENLHRILLPHLIDAPLEFYRSIKGSISFPGSFHLDKNEKIQPKHPVYSGKIVALVNEFTQSRGEFFAMALKNRPNSIITGGKTAGTDGDVADFIFPGNVKTFITGIGILNQDLSHVQKIGIEVDIPINETHKDLEDFKDSYLYKTLDSIKKNLNKNN